MKLYDLIHRPAPYAASPSIWTNVHISERMLEAHLSNENDAASYRTARRLRVCEFLWSALRMSPGSKLLDLGCGPGLYAHWFAKHGAKVRGLDISQHSLDYAQARATEFGLSIDYVQCDYRQPLGASAQDAAMLISEDYGVLKPNDRKRVLANIHSALKPGGLFALDVTSTAVWSTLFETATWSAEPSGFWRPHPYVLLQRTFLYPEQMSFCEMYAVCDDQISVYYTHQTAFTPASITAELEQAGFHDIEIYANLEGESWSEDSAQIGVIALK